MYARVSSIEAKDKQQVIQGLFRTGATCLSIVVVIGYSFPPFLIAVVPLAWFYGRVMKYELHFARTIAAQLTIIL